MMTENIEIKNKLGLHARPAAMFVQVANKFQSDVGVVKDGTEVNGKSVMGMMMLAAHKGTMLQIKINGPDEEHAMEALRELFVKNFDED
ncbi:MAG TPA: HPr family phosphocarrier protein [Elusimicrobiales bacterium]|nr:HPr family phosphocarrier protein [Elusimicrobiales bacterium]